MRPSKPPAAQESDRFSVTAIRQSQNLPVPSRHAGRRYRDGVTLVSGIDVGAVVPSHESVEAIPRVRRDVQRHSRCERTPVVRHLVRSTAALNAASFASDSLNAVR